MDIQFTLDEQSLQTLCFHYIVNQKEKSKTVLINSILMQLVSNSKNKLIDLFDICYRIVEDNKSESTKSMTDKQYLKNMANLLKQISAKYPKLITLASQQQIIKIIKFASNQVLCAVCGNDYIALIAMICTKTKPSTVILQRIQEMLMSQKMHVGSYRQITRLHLYFLLLRVLDYKNQTQLDTEYLNKVIQLVEDQKDPRNISCVFQIYSTLLNRSSRDHLMNIKKKLFDCLQMYYPIDFEGDADQHNIKLRDIAALLDQCLTNSLFVQQTRALLMIKMGAAPIGKYITTFISTRNHPISQASITFWMNLLKRTSQQQYMQEQYEQNAQHTLCDLIIQLLNRLIPVKGPIALSSYKAVAEWLDSLIGNKIMDNDQNSKSAPFIITSLKDIMSKCNNQVRHLVGSYVVHSFITNYKNVGQIIYKLGILVPVLQNHHKNLDIEKTGLLILTLSQIFYQQHEQPQPKLIVLKLFMILAREPIYSKMISQTNIHLTCIEHIKNILSNNKIDEKNMRIVKAYIDFLVELYYNDTKVSQLILESKRVEIWVYGLLTLANKNKQFYTQFLNMVQKNRDNVQPIYKQILGNLKQFKIQNVLEIVSRLPNQVDEYLSKSITQIIGQKSISLDLNEENIKEFVNQYINQTRMIYYLRNIWRPFLFNPQFLQYISQKLKQQIKSQPNSSLCLKTIAFYNKSLQALNINLQAQIREESVINSEVYKQQVYRMLPIQKNHTYTPQECISWPTLLHYAWSNSKQIRKDLIEYLPNSILTVEADRILPIILPSKDIQTLAKIMKNISQSTLVEVIIPFVINFLSIIDENTQVEKVVSLNKILFDLQARSKQSKDIHSLLVKNKGKILVAIEQKLLQSRKRRARQSSRAIFSLYNAFK